MADPIIPEPEPSVEIPLAVADETVEQDLSPGAADEGAGEGVADADADAIREATAAGWVPKEQWKGPPGKWKPAKDFVNFRDSVLPLVQKENRTLRDKNIALEQRLARLEQAETDRQQRSEQLSLETIQYERRQAAESGDWEKAGELDTKLIEAKVKEAVKPTKAAAPAIEPHVQEAIDGFAAENAWSKEPEMQNVLAETLFTMKQVGSINGLSPREALDKAAERVKRMYPDRFQNGRTRVPAMSETGGMNGNSRGNVRTWNDLKPDVRAALEPLLEQKGMTKQGILASCASNPSEYFRH